MWRPSCSCPATQAGRRASPSGPGGRPATCPPDGPTRQSREGEPYAPAATFRVVRALVEAAERLGARHHVGPVATEDALYFVTPETREALAARGLLAQGMEGGAIFTVAA